MDASQSITLVLKSLSGEEVEVHVNSQDTIGKVKRGVEEGKDEEHEVLLMLNNSILCDEQTVASLHLKDNDELNVVVKQKPKMQEIQDFIISGTMGKAEWTSMSFASPGTGSIVVQLKSDVKPGVNSNSLWLYVSASPPEAGANTDQDPTELAIAIDGWGDLHRGLIRVGRGAGWGLVQRDHVPMRPGDAFWFNVSNDVCTVGRGVTVGTGEFMRATLASGGQHWPGRYIGFASWETGLEFDWVRVYSSATTASEVLVDKQVEPSRVIQKLSLQPSSGKANIAGMHITGVSGTSTVVARAAIVQKGRWYFESELETLNVQIGWMQEGFVTWNDSGVGDDFRSWGYDGLRQMLWHGGKGDKFPSSKWKKTDVVGCLLDADAGTITYSLNGRVLEPTFKKVTCPRNGGLFPGITLNAKNAATLFFASNALRYKPHDCSTFECPEQANIVHAAISESSSSSTPTSDEAKASAPKSKPKHIMLSYQWNAQKLVEKVYAALKDKGFPVWMDTHGGISGGDLNEMMSEAVQNSAVVCYFVSSDYQTSVNCRKELTYADVLKVKSVPIRVSATFQPSGWLGLIASGKLYHDFSNADSFSKGLETLLEDVRPFVSATVVESAPLSISSAAPPGGPALHSAVVIPTKPVTEWTEADVSAWLASLRFQDHIKTFDQLLVNGELLLTLTDSDLEKELGMASGLTRRRLLMEVAKLKGTSK